MHKQPLTQLIDFGELTLGSRLKLLSDKLFDDVDQLYATKGIELSSRSFPILFLLNANGDSAITQLADQLGQAHSSVSQMSQKLIRFGLVIAINDPTDERRRLLSLTDEGKALFTTMQSLWHDIKLSIQSIISHSDHNLMLAIESFENQLHQQSLFQLVEKRQALRESQKVKIIPFSSEYRDDFKRLNVEWLEKYFYVEAIDDQVLSNPESEIIEPGGFIFFAQYQDKIIGTGALLKAQDGVYELTKMSVTEAYQGLKVGRKLACAAIEKFLEIKGARLFLESNSRLKPALHLYESLGFEHQPKKSDSHYQRADVHMVFNLDKYPPNELD